MISIKLFSQIFCKLLLACYASDLRSMFRQIWNKNHRGCFMSLVLKFLNPSFDQVKVRFLLQLQLLQWSELALSLSEFFVLWRHPDECSNIAFSTAWDFIKVFQARMEKVAACPGHSWWLAVNLGFSLPVHSHFCLDLQLMLDVKRNKLFP